MDANSAGSFREVVHQNVDDGGIDIGLASIKRAAIACMEGQAECDRKKEKTRGPRHRCAISSGCRGKRSQCLDPTSPWEAEHEGSAKRLTGGICILLAPEVSWVGHSSSNRRAIHLRRLYCRWVWSVISTPESKGPAELGVKAHEFVL